MERHEDRFPKRKNPRLRNYDYSQPGYYFVTICTKEKKCIFGEPGWLNQYGMLAQQCLDEIKNHTRDVQVDKYVVMPNHVHIILVLRGFGENLSTVIGQYKSAVARRIHKINSNMEIWQNSYHDHVIRGEKSYQRIWEYIDTNPMRWNDDCFYVE